MADEAPAAEPTALPGDIIQITDPAAQWYLALLIVENVARWGCQAYALIPHNSDETAQAHQRVRHGTFEVVGVARLVPAEIAQARADAIKTRRELERDKTKGGTNAKA